jgi:polysaccharide deacetylase family protein (PEP-CTERM system associated)
MRENEMKNALTVDLEDWYHASDLNINANNWEGYEDRIVDSTTRVLHLFDRLNIKATFFVLGCVAKKHPELIRSISGGGHEIGSHGVWHRLITKMRPHEFRSDLITSKMIIEDIIGKKIELFRAPSWSISRDNLWALQILSEEGFVCDSSLQPFATPLSGVNDVPCEPFIPVINGEKLNLIEFPVPILKLGKIPVPFAGGLYLRMMPLRYILYGLRQINKGNPGMIYFHPWELDLDQPVLKVSPHIRFTHYYNLKSTQQKLQKIFVCNEFAPLGEIIKNIKKIEFELASEGVI